MNTHRHIDKQETERQRQRNRETERQREKEREKERETHTQRQRQRNRETGRTNKQGPVVRSKIVSFSANKRTRNKETYLNKVVVLRGKLSVFVMKDGNKV